MEHQGHHNCDDRRMLNEVESDGMSTWMVWFGLLAVVILLTGLISSNPRENVLDRRQTPDGFGQADSWGSVGRQEREICKDFLRVIDGKKHSELEARQLRALMYCRDVVPETRGQ